MKYEIIDASEAPRKTSAKNERTTLIENLLSALTPGKVAAVSSDGGETIRGTKASISRRAKQMGRDVQVWDDGTGVYVELRDAPVRRRGRRPKGAIA